MKTGLPTAALVLATATAPLAGAIDAYLYESGTDVILTFSGTIDTTGFPAPVSTGRTFRGGDMIPNDGFWTVLPAAYSIYGVPVSGPDFGTGGYTDGSGQPANGDAFGLFAAGNIVALGDGYVSDTVISGSTTYETTDLATLGATVGTYTYSFGANGDENTANLFVGTLPPAAAVPLPAAGWLLLGGLGAMGAITRRRGRGAAESNANT